MAVGTEPVQNHTEDSSCPRLGGPAFEPAKNHVEAFQADLTLEGTISSEARHASSVGIHGTAG